MLCHMLEEKGVLADWKVDSAAISDYMVGCEVNPSSNHQLEKNGIKRSQHRAKQITLEDYENFHYIFGFDEYILEHLMKWKPASSTSLIRLLGDLDPESDRIIADPYYIGDDAAFEKVFAQCKRCLEVFVEEVLGKCKT
ncbi:low molecular weight phosphotyrosine protein phosphatase-like isoform X2 [Acanthaster planci]|nr:low molecular weight phosphotyrosine protein phosphatase-like isoform X2 [Acanthaster planci]